MINKKRLTQVQQWIKDNPTQVRMDDYYSNLKAVGSGAPGGCGTAGCIAGIAVALFRYDADLRKAHERYYYTHLRNRDSAKRLLGLTFWQADRLFIPYYAEVSDKCWPQRFQKRLDRATTEKGYAKVVIDRIEHFKKTNGRE